MPVFSYFLVVEPVFTGLLFYANSVMQRAICCRIFTPAARPEYPAASLRDYCCGVLTQSAQVNWVVDIENRLLLILHYFCPYKYKCA
jgi:hypothetical protein